MYIEIKPIEPVWEKYTRKDELYELRSRKLEIKVHSDLVAGVLCYEIQPGYFTDFRSGPSIINPVIPKIGNMLLMVAWLVHDINYHGFLSRALSDKLLREMLEYAGMGKVKRNAVYYSVRIAGGSHYNYLSDDQGPIYNHNKTLVKFRWDSGNFTKSFINSSYLEAQGAYPVLIDRHGG